MKSNGDERHVNGISGIVDNARMIGLTVRAATLSV